MTDLEDKILGEKKEYYCSSSESECEEDSDEESAASKVAEVDRAPPTFERDADCDGSANTGPKGVIRDWQRYKQLESEQRAEREREKLALIQKLSLTCRSDAASATKDEAKDAEMDDFLEDAFLLEYSKRRMQEMLEKVSGHPKYGDVISLDTGQEYLDAIDKESKTVTVIVHIYENQVPACKIMNECIKTLCREYPQIKFCKMLASVAGLSRQFKANGVPALLVYKNGSLVGNYVQLTEEFGNEFEASDVENFLIENGVMTDGSFIPSLLK